MLRQFDRLTVLSSTLPFGPALRPPPQAGCRRKTSLRAERTQCEAGSKEGLAPKGAKSKDKLTILEPTEGSNLPALIVKKINKSVSKLYVK